MEDAERAVAEIRRLEAEVLADRKNANNILELRRRAESEAQCDDDSALSKEIKLAAVHSLRRIFSSILESGVILASKSISSSSSTSSSASLQKYVQWIISQINSYIDLLCGFIHDEDIDMQAVSIRTLMELVMREHMYKPEMTFGVHTYTKLLRSLLLGPDIDVDILLMFRDEVLDKADCIFYSLRIIRTFLLQIKEVQKELLHTSSAKNRQETLSRFVGSESGFGSKLATKMIQNFRFAVCSQNVLDLLRIIEVPGNGTQYSEGDEEEMLFCVDSEEPPKKSRNENGDDNDDSSASEDSDHEEQEEEEQRPRILGQRGRPIKHNSGTNKPRKHMSVYHQIRDVQTHKNMFSKAWLALLSLPLTRAQHKIILKHLPEQVIPDMAQPMLIADYLTRSMDCGGYTAVLALEGLFNLIVQYNLDYPKYFESLYKLCTRENFAAKYRSKFLELLHNSLRSTNIPAYTAAAFIKKFAHIGLFGESPTACFCIAMVITLLRSHPKCIVMIHREPTDDYNPEPFDDKGSTDFEKMDAMRSSLWEIQALQSHALPQIAKLAKFLEDPDSTDVMKPPTDPRDYINMTYETMMEQEVNTMKAYVKKLDAEEAEMLQEIDTAQKLGRKVEKNRRFRKKFDYTQRDVPAAQTYEIPEYFLGKDSFVRQALNVPFLGEMDIDEQQQQEWINENTKFMRDAIFKRIEDYDKKIAAGGKDEYELFTPFDPQEDERRRRWREDPLNFVEEEADAEGDENTKNDESDDAGSNEESEDEDEEEGYLSEDYPDEGLDQDNELF